MPNLEYETALKEFCPGAEKNIKIYHVIKMSITLGWFRGCIFSLKWHSGLLNIPHNFLLSTLQVVFDLISIKVESSLTWVN